MRSENWKGLITNASPYALPPGSATEQVNLQCHVPGQMATRGGMNAISCVEAMVEIRDVYPFRHAGVTKMVALKPDGTLAAFTSPSVAAATVAPTVSSMSPASGQVQSNYIGQFYESGGEPPV